MNKKKKWVIAGVIAAIPVLAAAVIGTVSFMTRMKHDFVPSRVFTDSATGKAVIELNVGSIDNKELHADFVKKYPEILRKKYASLYQSDPGRYGKFNWENIELRLKTFPAFRGNMIVGRATGALPSAPLWVKLTALARGGKLKEGQYSGAYWQIYYKTVPDVIWTA